MTLKRLIYKKSLNILLWEVKAVGEDSSILQLSEIRTMQRGKAYIEATPENFTYDDDGNMTYDGRWNYSWNSRGQIRDIETSWNAREDGIPYEAYTYTYDWTCRKIQTDYYVHDENWTLVYTNKRYYDDYNLIYETTEYYDGTTPTDVKKYYYGTDLLGSVYGSAGTGGLRMAEVGGDTVFAFNNQVGSIEALFGADSATAAQARAEYIYSSYGEILMKSGDLADKNNITYSTRYQEANTGLVSYAYRHYSPRLKKWINKDPIAEHGGINLYQMVGNQPIQVFDLLGYVECGCYPDGAPIPEVNDDANVLCCKNKQKIVSIKIAPMKPWLLSVGHASISTPNITFGLYPNGRDYFGGKGKIKDEDRNDYDYRNSYFYKACPETVKKIEDQYEEDKKNPPVYHLFNNGDYNCCGYACKVLEKSGITPPFPSNTPNIAPGLPGVKGGKY